MSVGEAIYTILSGDASVTDRVGGRMAPGSLPHGADLPAITWEMAGLRAETLAHMDGVRVSQLKVTCWSDSYAEAQELSEIVRDAFNGAKGTYGTTALHAVRSDMSDDDYVPPTDGSERGLMPVVVDLRLWHEEL